jgi:hypothetical protein
VSSNEDDYKQLILSSAIVSGTKALLRFPGAVVGAISHCTRTRLRVNSITPVHGPIGGNTPVTITGTGFLAGATVTIGAAAAITTLNDNTITATTGLRGAGPEDVRVTNTNADTHALVGGYLYDGRPRVDSIALATGPTDGTRDVVITGAGFLPNPTVLIGGVIDAGSVARQDVTRINARTAAHPAARVDVVVTNTDGQHGTLNNGYEYRVPAVTRIDPAGGTTVGGTHVTIFGRDFVNGATVTFDGQAGGNRNVVSDTQMTADTPPHLSGPVDVRVTNPSGDHGTCERGYRYRLPRITGVDPDSVPYYGGTAIRITGENFGANPTVAVGVAAANVIDNPDSSTINARTAAGTAGARNVVVTNSDGNASSVFPITLVPLAVTGLDIARGTSNGGTRIVISGTSFNAGATVTFGGNAANVAQGTETALTVDTPANPHGTETVDVVVTNPDAQTVTRAGAYLYLAPPSVVSVTPNSGAHDGGTLVMIRGADFTNNVTVRVDGRDADNIARLDNHTIRANTPAGPAGAVNIRVINSDNQEVTLANSFTYNPAPLPRNAVIYPGGHDRASLNIIVGGHPSLNLALDHLHNDGELDAREAVAANQIPLRDYHVHLVGGARGLLFVQHQHTRQGDADNAHQILDVSANRLENNYGVNLIAIAQNGRWHPNGGATFAIRQQHRAQVALCFANAPAVLTAVANALALTSIAHSSGPLNGGWTVDLTGANFPANCTVTFGGTPSGNVNRIGATHLTAVVPARAAGAATVHVRVTDPDGVYVELQNAFRYQALTVVAIARPNGPQAGGETVEISGTGFQDDATVDIGVNALQNIVNNGPTSITGDIPQGAAAVAVNVVVTNPAAAAVTGTLAGGYTYY